MMESTIPTNAAHVQKLCIQACEDNMIQSESNVLVELTLLPATVFPPIFQVLMIHNI